MEKILTFLFFVLLVVLLVYILTRRRPEPDYLQGDAVDRVLYWHFHPPEDDDREKWPAGKAWHEYGRKMTVALIRQGIGDLLDEENVETYDPVFKLGFTLGEDGKTKALDALRKQVERRDATIKELREERDDLLHQLEQLRDREQRPPASEPVRSVRAVAAQAPDDYNRLMEEYWSSPKSMEELLAERGYVRAETKPEPAPEPEPLPEPEPVPEPLRFCSTKERNAAVVEYLKDHTTAEAAAAFDLSESLVRNIKSKANKLLNVC